MNQNNTKPAPENEELKVPKKPREKRMTRQGMRAFWRKRFTEWQMEHEAKIRNQQS